MSKVAGELLRQGLKRLFDIIVSATALLCLSPLIVLLYAFVWFSLGRPVFFRQARPGLNERLFTLYKFRTMRDVTDKSGNTLPDEQRLTAFGKWLRATSLDELPELLNVLKGDMSLVGPRPLLAEYLPLYSDRQRQRHAVRPGLTGWAQVNGRNLLDWNERFELDLWYVEHWNLLLDFRIIAMTLVKVAQREGISAAAHATMPKFTGSA